MVTAVVVQMGMLETELIIVIVIAMLMAWLGWLLVLLVVLAVKLKWWW